MASCHMLKRAKRYAIIIEDDTLRHDEIGYAIDATPLFTRYAIIDDIHWLRYAVETYASHATDVIRQGRGYIGYTLRLSYDTYAAGPY